MEWVSLFFGLDYFCYGFFLGGAWLLVALLLLLMLLPLFYWCILMGFCNRKFSFPCRARVLHSLSLTLLVVVRSWDFLGMRFVVVIIH